MSGQSLHEFIAQNRDEILALSIASMKQSSPGRSAREIAADFNLVLEEVIGALRDAAGLSHGSAPTHPNPEAAGAGGQPRHRDFELAKIPLHFGGLCTAIGDLGARHDLSFSAREYKVFTQCIDTFISSAIERCSTRAWREHEDQTAQRIGFFAHELRNALSSARMSFAILKRGELGINSTTGGVLDRSLGRLDHLISQTLVAIRLQAALELDLARMRVRRLLHDIEETAVPERGIRVALDADDSLEVEADERLLVSAMSNLLQNAFKFTKTGGRIQLRASRDGPWVIMEVEDECGGLPPGREEELFEPYVRRGLDKRGLGLGLAITREAIEAHRGVIAVRNLPGRGCVFTVKVGAPGP